MKNQLGRMSQLGFVSMQGSRGLNVGCMSGLLEAGKARM